jgi:hypothetical protein
MAKSKGRSPFGRGSSGFGRRGGTVTVIEDHVSRSYARTAKIAFWVIATVVSVLAATVASSYWHPIIALAAGIGLGVAVALPVSAVIAVWPVLRVLWWWLPEIIAVAVLVYGFTYLCQHTPLYVRLAVVLSVAAPAAFPQVRAEVMKVAYCFISRHRIRTCFAEFIIGNNRASLPFLLWAKPTRVGESVWVWLRPGLSAGSLNERLEQIAVACWADKVTIERASTTNAAYLRIDITRRDALTGTVASPLTEHLDTPTPGFSFTPAGDDLTTGNVGLDILDVTEDQVTAQPADRTAPRSNGARTTRKPATVPASSDDDPYADYR